MSAKPYKLICLECGEQFESATARKYCFQCGSRCDNKLKYKMREGARYGMLTTIRFEQRQGTTQKHWYVLCRCDCGTEKWIMWHNVATRNQLSCGCLRLEESIRVRRENKEKRRRDIVQYAVDNPTFTYEMIADEFDVSRERIRQVLVSELGTEAVQRRKRNRSVIYKEQMDELERLRAIVDRT